MTRRILELGVLACAIAGLCLAAIPDASIAAPPASKGTITGTVTKDGSPAAGATVRLYGEGAIDYLAETTSDSSGNYRFRRVNAGDYSVVATALSTNLTCHGSASAT